MLTRQDAIDIEFQGLMQLIAGKPALDVVDVTYTCPTCGIKHRIRFQQNPYQG